MDVKIFSKLIGFSNFPIYFYMRTLIDYDYDMKFLKNHWYILVLYPSKSIKNSFIIIVSLYFHVLEARKRGLMHGWANQFCHTWLFLKAQNWVIFPFLI
jgi:hypothetical protein